MKANPIVYVFMEISISKEIRGRLTFKLFNKDLPVTCENFRQLCTGENSNKALTYKNCPFHRIIPNFVVQGGDITNHNGTGGNCIYGEEFEDEGYKYLHSGVGILAMANIGPDTNQSQFYITLTALPHLDKNFVVFGQLVSGFELLKEMASYGSTNGTPSKEIIVSDCGQLDKIDETTMQN